MQTNGAVWPMYAEGYVDPLYTPYTGDCLRPSPEAGGRNSSTHNNLDFNAVRQIGSSHGEGLDFMRLHADDPCPPGFEQKPAPGRDPRSGRRSSRGSGNACPDRNPNLLYCQKKTLTHEPVFYTDKAFVAKKQYPRGYADCVTSNRYVSQPTDMRSVVPHGVPCSNDQRAPRDAGQFRVSHFPVDSSTGTRYERPYVGAPSAAAPSASACGASYGQDRYPRDPNFGSSRYQQSGTKDSYLA